MNDQQARQFAEEWIEAWNSHDLNNVLAHYADPLEFHSPFIPLLQFNTTGIITNKTDLRKYFELGLTKYPDLHFVFHHYFVGINTLVLYYTSVNGKLAAEVFEFNAAGKALKVYCHYSDPY